MHRQIKSILAGISLLAIAGSAQAAIVQYTSLGDFLSIATTSDSGSAIALSSNFTTNGAFATNAGDDGLFTINSSPMTFSGFSAYEIGMTFGNDQTLFDVTLSVFDGMTLLGSVVVASNGNDLNDQFIGLSSMMAFDNVSLSYGAGSGNLSHFISRIDIGYDNVSVSAVPVPAAVWLFGTALLGLFGFGKRRKTT